MAEPRKDQIAVDRAIFLAIGAVAGAAAYLLVEVLPDRVENERVILLISAATGGFFSALLAAVGPLRIPRAVQAAALSALPAAALLYWAGFRFSDVEDFLETGHPPIAFLVIVSVSLPFLIAAFRAPGGWRQYPELFTQAWNIVVRYAAAWLFTGVFWAVVFLSDALFGLVGLDIIEDLLEIDWVPYVLTGAVLGLAMAVVVELSDYVSPFLILRLLRLLMPELLIVTLVFLVALPLQGWSDLFGGLSAAATLMAMAFGIATVITSALDQTDAEAANSRVMRWSGQALGLALPVLGGLAVFAIWLRVADYGWTPDRLAAATCGIILTGYGISYAIAVALRRDWMRRIRGANIAMALLTIAVSALWLSPAFDPQRFTARDQVARFASGSASVETLDLWFIRNELGRAGVAAVDDLAKLDHPEADELAIQIERLRTAETRYGFERAAAEVKLPALRAKLMEKLLIVPPGANLPDAMLATIDAHRLGKIVDGCDIVTPGGHPGCALILADFAPSRDGSEGLLIYATSRINAAIRPIWANDAGADFGQLVFLAGQGPNDVTPDTIDALHSGNFALGRVPVMALTVGETQIAVEP